MAGTVVTTEYASRSRSVKVIKFDWLSDGAGAADATTTELYDGKIIAVTTDPQAAAPDPNYNITLTDSNGVDVCLGAALLRHTTNTEYLAEGVLGAVAGSTLTLGVTAAGAANEGDMYVWIR
jgi:hypothetical protein